METSPLKENNIPIAYYFFNPITNEKQWENNNINFNLVFKEQKDPNGKSYYVNIIDRTSTWNIPTGSYIAVQRDAKLSERMSPLLFNNEGVNNTNSNYDNINNFNNIGISNYNSNITQTNSNSNQTINFSTQIQRSNINQTITKFNNDQPTNNLNNNITTSYSNNDKSITNHNSDQTFTNLNENQTISFNNIQNISTNIPDNIDTNSKKSISPKFNQSSYFNVNQITTNPNSNQTFNLNNYPTTSTTPNIISTSISEARKISNNLVDMISAKFTAKAPDVSTFNNSLFKTDSTVATKPNITKPVITEEPNEKVSEKPVRFRRSSLPNMGSLDLSTINASKNSNIPELHQNTALETISPTPLSSKRDEKERYVLRASTISNVSLPIEREKPPRHSLASFSENIRTVTPTINVISPYFASSPKYSPTGSVSSVNHDAESSTLQFQNVLSTPNKQNDWIECKEVDSGRKLWYSKSTLQIIFEKKPQFDRILSDSIIVTPVRKSMHRTRVSGCFNNFSIATPSPTARSFSHSRNNTAIVDTSSNFKLNDEEILYSETPETANYKLLNFSAINWDFKNKRCEHYRARAAKVDHTEFAPDIESLVCPRYFSSCPIPPLLNNSFFVSIKIPSDYVSQKTKLSAAKIMLKMNDDGFDAIDRVMRKCSDLIDPLHFVLKVCGRLEYIYGQPRVIDYEYVRYCLRHQSEISLQLVCMPIRNAPKWPIEWMKPSVYNDKYINEEVLLPESYQNISFNLGCGDSISAEIMPYTYINSKFKVKIFELGNVLNFPRWTPNICEIVVKTALFYGADEIPKTTRETFPTINFETPSFLQILNFDILISNLPRETRVCFMVYGVNIDRSKVLLGYVVQNIVDEHGSFITGLKILKLWPVHGKVQKTGGKDDIYSYVPQAPTWENLTSGVNGPTICVKFDDFAFKAVAPLIPELINRDYEIPNISISKSTATTIDNILKYDPIREIPDEEKQVLWANRFTLIGDPIALPKLLRCVNWFDRQQAAEARQIIAMSAPLHPYEAIELLDSRFPDTNVRQFAVRCLEPMADSELAELLLQLTQILKYEQYHDSLLTRYLIDRCLSNPYQLGHYFFWHVKAELSNMEFVERYSLILEEYLKHSGHHAVELQVQNNIILRLQDAAELIIKSKNVNKLTDDQCKFKLREQLDSLNTELPSKFQVSLNPRLQAKRLKPEKCKYMSSKKIPLWLVFENADPSGGDIITIFKSGDDLRQDILTLQLVKLMDRIWLYEKIDLRLKPYSVIATGVNKDGEGVGMIEVVSNSSTISDIQIKYGGGAAGAMLKTPLSDYIKNYNQGVHYDESVVNFLRSCAGYCVASYVLGIGDRHNGNIMLTESGHIFHIDFGHFLGNFKKKFGFKRERSPFVFTQEMAYVIGGENFSTSNNYAEFVELCCNAYNILRKNSSLFMNLFVLMQTAGMPELSSFEDIFYLRDMLNLQYSDAAASQSFRSEIKASVGEKWRRFDNLIHNVIHG